MGWIGLDGMRFDAMLEKEKEWKRWVCEDV